MMRMCNKYCSNCLSTQRFHDLGSHLICERCSKRLERILPVTPRTGGSDDGRGEGNVVAWVDRTEVRREAM